MPSNIKEFERDLRLFQNVIVPEELNKLVQRLSLQVLRRVVLKTPVDTGRARGNWIVAVNRIPQGIVEIEKLTRQEATDLSLSRGIPVIEKSKPFTAISIANNLPYIGVLEFGGSKQAPQGMVRVTLAEIQSQFS